MLSYSLLRSDCELSYALADEADFIALRSQLTLPTKPTSLGDEVVIIFG